MSDYLSILTGSNSQMTQSEQLVQSYLLTRQPELDALADKKELLEQKQVFYNSLYSKLNSLVSKLDDFDTKDYDKEDLDADFFAYKSSSSSTEFFTAKADDDALLGATDVRVNKLAANDTMISKTLGLDDTDAFSGISGEQTIKFTIDDEEVEVEVEFTGSETAEQAMTKIANAINNIDSDDIYLTAALIKGTTETGRLSFSSSNTGSGNRIQFEDSEVLSRLGITQADLNSGSTERTVMSEDSAGYLEADYNDLNSEMVIGGITVVRDSNTIDDAMPGVTFTLVKPHDEEDQNTKLTTTIDTAAVANVIQPLLDRYNELITFTSSSKTMLRSDSAINNLKYTLRDISSQAVSSITNEDAPNRLTGIGIEIASNGTLSIGDRDRLEEVLKEDPQMVADLFTSEDGFVAKLNDAIKNLSGTDGLIQARKSSISEQIEANEEKTDNLEYRIEKAANVLRNEYEDILQVYIEAENQYTYLSSYY